MASISSAGIGSGLDVNSIITQLMALERRPLTTLESTKATLDAKISSIGQLQSLMSTLRDKAGALSLPALWARSTGTSSAATSVSVTTGANAVAGSYAVQVQQLAAPQTVSSRAFAASDTAATFGPGTLTIELGAHTGTPTSGFTPKAGATAVAITIDAADDTLAEVRDKINAANAGVTATIVRDDSGARLALRSTSTGAANGFRVVATETADDGVAANGLSALAYDPLAVGSQMTLSQTARDAQATVNGIAITSASNTLADVSDGVTLKLLAVTTGAVDVTVAPDSAALKTAIADFTAAFNAVSSFIRDQTKYDETSKVAGAMQGDSLPLGLQRQLRALLGEASSASATFDRLADIGITLKADGTLTTDDALLAAGLAKPAELRAFFATDGDSTAATGVMRRIKELGDALLGSDGVFESRTDSLRTRLERNADDRERVETRLEQTEARMRAQYEALDRNMAKLNGLSTYVTQQMEALNNFYKSDNR
jgi:flagellar hook-associated protein 2